MIHWLTGLRASDKNMDISETNQKVSDALNKSFT